MAFTCAHSLSISRPILRACLAAATAAPGEPRLISPMASKVEHKDLIARLASSFEGGAPTQMNCAASGPVDRKSTRLNSSHANISYAVFCLKKKKNYETR